MKCISHIGSCDRQIGDAVPCHFLNCRFLLKFSFSVREITERNQEGITKKVMFTVAATRLVNTAKFPLGSLCICNIVSLLWACCSSFGRHSSSGSLVPFSSPFGCCQFCSTFSNLSYFFVFFFPLQFLCVFFYFSLHMTFFSSICHLLFVSVCFHSSSCHVSRVSSAQAKHTCILLVGSEATFYMQCYFCHFPSVCFAGLISSVPPFCCSTSPSFPTLSSSVICFFSTPLRSQAFWRMFCSIMRQLNRGPPHTLLTRRRPTFHFTELLH